MAKGKKVTTLVPKLSPVQIPKGATGAQIEQALDSMLRRSAIRATAKQKRRKEDQG